MGQSSLLRPREKRPPPISRPYAAAAFSPYAAAARASRHRQGRHFDTTRSRTTTGAAALGLAVQGARPPDPLPPTPQCLFPPNGKSTPDAVPATSLDTDITCEEFQLALTKIAGTVVTPVDALARFHHYTDHFPDDYVIDGGTVTALLKLSGASAPEIRTFLSSLAGSSAPESAGSTSGGLGAQDATASDRVTECLCAPSPNPPDDTGIKVPTPDGGWPCARRLQLNEKTDEEAPKPGEATDEDAWMAVDDNEAGEQTDEDVPSLATDEDAWVDDNDEGEQTDEDLLFMIDPGTDEDAPADPILAGDYLDEDDLDMVLAFNRQPGFEGLSPRAACNLLVHPTPAGKVISQPLREFYNAWFVRFLFPRDARNLLARPTFQGKAIPQPLREFYDDWFVRLGPLTPATLSTLPDATPDDTQSPPPLNHPPTWNLGASAPSEGLGTPNGMGAGMEGKDAAPAEAEDHDKACGLPMPATMLLTANHDHDDAQSPPPLNHPPSWNLGASAPSEDLGTPNGMGAGMEGKDAAPAALADAEDKACGLPLPATTLLTANLDHDDAQSPPPLNHPPTWTLGASAPSEDLGTPQLNGMSAGMAAKDTAPVTAPADADDNGDRDDDEKDPEDKDEADTRLSGA